MTDEEIEAEIEEEYGLDHDGLYRMYTKETNFDCWGFDELAYRLYDLTFFYKRNLYNYKEWLKEYNAAITFSERKDAREQVEIYGSQLEGLMPVIRACRAAYKKQCEKARLELTQFPIEEADAKLKEFKRFLSDN